MSLDVGAPLGASNKETGVQRVLREALLRVHEVGVCEQAAEEGDWCDVNLSVCGLPVLEPAPSFAVIKAAELILEAVSRGSGDEEGSVGLGYIETLETIMIYFDACSWGDAEACVAIEEVYIMAGNPKPGPRPPINWPACTPS